MTTRTNPSTRNAYKAAAFALLWAFLGILALNLLGITNVVADWAIDWSTNGEQPDLPDLSTYAAAVISAAQALAVGLLALFVRYTQTRTGLPGHPPDYS